MKSTVTQQKLRGGYYTPTPIGQFLASWAIRTPNDRVLEPSCGDGELLGSAARELLARGASPRDVAKQLQGVEFEAAEAAKAHQRLNDMGVRLKPPAIRSGDFFQYAEEIIDTQETLFRDSDSDGSVKPAFDAVIGNPPFIRYQNFLEEHRKRAFSLMNSMGMHSTRLTNAWVPFVAVSAALLKPHPRLSFTVGVSTRDAEKTPTSGHWLRCSWPIFR